MDLLAGYAWFKTYSGILEKNFSDKVKKTARSSRCRACKKTERKWLECVRRLASVVRHSTTTKARHKRAKRPQCFVFAFAAARLSEADLSEAIRGRLITALEKGEGIGETWNDIATLTEGWSEKFSPGYWETVFRTNVQTAYNAARLLHYQSNPPSAWELLFIEDVRQSSICKNLASIVSGKALPADHNFWQTYGFPPYHFNCRTTFRAVYDYSAETPHTNPSMNSIRRAKFKPDPGFGGNPLDKESFWRLTPGMLKRIEKYGIKSDIEKFAKECGIKNYDVRLVTPH